MPFAGCRSSHSLRPNGHDASYFANNEPHIDSKHQDSVADTEADESTIKQVAFLQSEDIEDQQESEPLDEAIDENDSQSELVEESSVTSSDFQAVQTIETHGDICSLPLIEQLALDLNPAVARAQAQLAALHGKKLQAGLPPNPITGIVGEDINEDGSGGRYGVLYGNRVVRGGKLGLARKQVNAEMKAQRILLDELRQRVLTDVRLAYYELLVAIEKSRLANQLVVLAQEAVTATEQLVEAQELARTSLLQAELEKQQARVIEQRAVNETVAARRKLAALIDEADLPFRQYEGSLDESANPIQIEHRFEQLLGSSPEIAKLFAQVDVSRRNLDFQRSQQIPDVTWQSGVAFDTASDDVVANFQISWPIMKYNRNQGAICQARNEIIATERSVEQKALQIRQRLVTAYRNYWDARIQIEANENEILPKAKETLELVTLGYRSGEVDFLQQLTALRTFFQFNLENINQKNELWKHRIRIEGMLLSGSLDAVSQ